MAWEKVVVDSGGWEPVVEEFAAIEDEVPLEPSEIGAVVVMVVGVEVVLAAVVQVVLPQVEHDSNPFVVVLQPAFSVTPPQTDVKSSYRHPEVDS